MYIVEIVSSNTYKLLQMMLAQKVKKKSVQVY